MDSNSIFFRHYTGLLCHLLGIRAPEQIGTHPLRGAVFETMVVNELLKTRTHQGLPSDLSYWRDKTGHEVDIVLEREGQPIPVEIKSGHGMRGFSEDGEPAPLSYLFPMLRSLLLPALLLPTVLSAQVSTLPAMMYGDTTRKGVPFSKDPHVVAFGGRYLLYYTLPAHSDKNHPVKGLGIGIAESTDLTRWRKVGEITPAGEPETNGIAAPCALVIGRQVHLFYQTYGNGRKDAICHAVSDDGLAFRRNPTNPVFRPTGDWNCGRAIDAEVFPMGDRYLLYFATRDTAYKVQLQGVASAPLNTSFNRDQWTQLTDAPILKPEYPWEGQCVEGASIVRKGNTLYMFYAGAYNNNPQQIGVAKSSDGIRWQRLSNKPFLANGDPGSWNASESGHPHLFQDSDGRTWLFYQGNNDNGKTWYLSNREVLWNAQGPYLR